MDPHQRHDASPPTGPRGTQWQARCADDSVASRGRRRRRCDARMQSRRTLQAAWPSSLPSRRVAAMLVATRTPQTTRVGGVGGGMHFGAAEAAWGAAGAGAREAAEAAWRTAALAVPSRAPIWQSLPPPSSRTRMPSRSARCRRPRCGSRAMCSRRVLPPAHHSQRGGVWW